MAPRTKLRKDDEVIVISGKDRGKTGRVLRVDPKRERVYVEGLNIIKRHERPQQVRDTTRGAQVGGVIEKEGPIHVSNVQVLDPKTSKPTRIRIERDGDGRHRVATRSGERLE